MSAVLRRVKVWTCGCTVFRSACSSPVTAEDGLCDACRDARGAGVGTFHAGASGTEPGPHSTMHKVTFSFTSMLDLDQGPAPDSTER